MTKCRDFVGLSTTRSRAGVQFVQPDFKPYGAGQPLTDFQIVDCSSPGSGAVCSDVVQPYKAALQAKGAPNSSQRSLHNEWNAVCHADGECAIHHIYVAARVDPGGLLLQAQFASWCAKEFFFIVPEEVVDSVLQACSDR